MRLNAPADSERPAVRLRCPVVDEVIPRRSPRVVDDVVAAGGKKVPMGMDRPSGGSKACVPVVRPLAWRPQESLGQDRGRDCPSLLTPGKQARALRDQGRLGNASLRWRSRSAITALHAVGQSAAQIRRNRRNAAATRSCASTIRPGKDHCRRRRSAVATARLAALKRSCVPASASTSVKCGGQAATRGIQDGS